MRKPTGTLQERLLAILAEGGPRKLHILAAWGANAGFNAMQFAAKVIELQNRGWIVRSDHGREGTFLGLAAGVTIAETT